MARAALDTKEGLGGAAQKEEVFRLSGRCVSVRVCPARGALSEERAGASLTFSSAFALGYQASDFLGTGAAVRAGGAVPVGVLPAALEEDADVGGDLPTALVTGAD